MSTTEILHWASAHSPWSYIAAGVVALVVLPTVLLMLRAPVRAMRRWDLADTLTVMIALATTVYAGTGNWRFLGVAMHYGNDLRAVLVCALEGAVVVEGLRSRKNIADTGKAGADGVGLWVLAGLSSLLASSAAGSLQEALGRLAIPLVAAWLWERLLAPQRRARKALRQASPIRWRITPERILVWLRLADATDTDVSSVDAGRRVSRYLRATDRAARKWRRPWSPEARSDRARMRLTTHALMHGDPTGVHEQLADSAFADALRRLGIAAKETPEGPVEPVQNRPVLNVLSPFTRPFPPQDSPFRAHVNTLPSPPAANPVEQARELHQQGLSYQQIGDRLGMSKTWAFNAVNAQVPASVNGHSG